MSFLIDAPWLYANGATYARRTPEDSRNRNAKKLGVATIVAFWGLSIPLYLNKRWTTPVWRICRAKSGRDWMVNSGVARFDAERISPRGHAVSVVLFASYPLWLWLGYRRGLRAGG